MTTGRPPAWIASLDLAQVEIMATGRPPAWIASLDLAQVEIMTTGRPPAWIASLELAHQKQSFPGSCARRLSFSKVSSGNYAIFPARNCCRLDSFRADCILVMCGRTSGR
jgi:hypothetical protein